MSDTKYIVRSVNPDDVVLRPIIVQVDDSGRETGDTVDGWKLVRSGANQIH